MRKIRLLYGLFARFFPRPLRIDRVATTSGPVPVLAAIRHPGERTVNKSELIDAIARHADISKAAAGRALDATLGAIAGSLKRGDIVTLVGFGSFFVGKRTARAGRNPRTGEVIGIRAAKVPKFRAGKALKDAVN